MPARVTRVRSVDTNPVVFPTRLACRPPSAADRFAKCATAVTALYSLKLDSGTPLVAKTSWVRFIPGEAANSPDFSREPADGSLGMGEVYEVPYDATVLDLADPLRRLAILDWLQDNLLALAAALDWDIRPLIDAYDACRAEECQLSQRGPTKASADRQHTAHAEFEIDGEGDGWSWVVVTDNNGAVEAVSDRHDSPPSMATANRALKSLRWDGDAVTWTPWTDDVVPRGHDHWMGSVQRFSLGGGPHRVGLLKR